jgi:hypothetical protein
MNTTKRLHTHTSSIYGEYFTSRMLTRWCVRPKRWAYGVRIARHFHAGFDAICRSLRYLRAKVMEHENADGGGQVAMQPPNIDVGYEARERGLIFSSDLFKAVPKVVLEADAGFVP